MSVKRITRCALFTAAALLMFMIESLFPPLMAFAPGAKLGLSNAVTLIALILLGASDAFLILIARCLLGALFTANAFSVVYSLPAGLVSLVLQTVLYKLLFPKISLMSISFAGAVAHNTVQLIIASLIAGVNMLPLLPLMLAAGTAAGLIVGLIAYFTVKLLPQSVYGGRKVLIDKRSNKDEV